MKALLAYALLSMMLAGQPALASAPASASASATASAAGPAAGAPARHARYRATVSGQNQPAPNGSVAYGIVDLRIDRVAWTMKLTVDLRDFSGAGSPAAHIHCCTGQALAGLAQAATMQPSLPDFPDFTSFWAGAYETTLDLNDAASYSAGFISANGGSVTAARDALLAGLDQRRGYFNVRSDAHPQGEVRGFLVPTPVPEPHTWAMLLVGLAALALRARRGMSSGPPSTQAQLPPRGLQALHALQHYKGRLPYPQRPARPARPAQALEGAGERDAISLSDLGLSAAKIPRTVHISPLSRSIARY